MARVAITESYLEDIADAIRNKTGMSSATYYPSEMADAIMTISGGGGITPTGTISITENGTYNVTSYASAEVDVPTGSTINNQNKSVTPTESQQSITADSGYTGLGTVTVGAISSTYVGSGITRNPQLTSDVSNHSITVNANPGYYSDSQYIEIPAAQFGETTGRYSGRDGYFYFTLPINTAGYWDIDKSFNINPSNITYLNVRTGDATITPTESSQQIATYGDFIDGTITVDAIPSTYVGSGITQRSSTDLTTSGATVTVPAGYYEEAASKSVSSGSAVGPTSLSGSSATITTGTNTITLTKTGVATTPTVSAGYISNATASSATVTLTASVTTKAAATITPGTTNQTIASGTYLTGTQTISGDEDLVASNIKKNVTIFGVTGTYEAGSSSPTIQSLTVTPSESQQTFNASGVDGYKPVTVNAISSTYIGSEITRRSDSDLTVWEDWVTVPAGYYEEEFYKSVGTMTLPTSTASSATSGYTSKATIERSTSDQYINIAPGYNSAGGYYKISAVANGSTTPASSITGTSATISTGTNTITLTKSVSNTPQVTAGYVSSGTTGNSNVSLTASVTVNPTPTASGATVTIPAGYYTESTSKAVTTMTLPTSASSSATSGYTKKATISRSISAQYINIAPGYNSAGGYYEISAVANGSATGPTSLSGSSATVTTGTNTLTLTKTGVSTTPIVSAGYVSSATSSTATVTLTASVTTKAAATITPGTTNQTIASGTYLTGTQTIAGDADLVASNIVSGVQIFGVTGNVVLQNYYTGSSAPSSSTGSNGDLYLQS